METLAEFFERTKHKCQRSLRKLGHSPRAVVDGRIVEIDESVIHLLAVNAMALGTSSGTSIASDSDDPKNGGSKPEER